VVIERLAYKPLRDAPKIAALITAIGVSLFLEYFTALHQVFAELLRVPPPLPGGLPGDRRDHGHQTSGSFFWPRSLPRGPAVTSSTGRKSGGGCVPFPTTSSRRTHGVNVNAVISFTFGLGAALAG